MSCLNLYNSRKMAIGSRRRSFKSCFAISPTKPPRAIHDRSSKCSNNCSKCFQKPVSLKKKSFRPINKICWTISCVARSKSSTEGPLMNEVAAYRQLLRSEFSYFVRAAFNAMHPATPYAHNWHIDALAYELGRVAAGEERRLLVNMPPRALKSFSVSVTWTAWLLGKDPAKEIMVISYGDEVAGKLARETRELIESDFYRVIFPRTRLRRSAATDLETTRSGGRYAATNGGVITGRGSDLIILDDPQKPEDAKSRNKRESTIDWFGSTMSTRLNNPITGAVIVVQQRLHETDISGHLLANGGWRRLSFPAVAVQSQTFQLSLGETYTWAAGKPLHAERLPISLLEQKRREMGTANFEAQYQQCPVPETGNLIQPGWFKAYEEAPDVPGHSQVVQSWDLAVGTTGDYCACVTALIYGNSVRILDVFREKLSFPDQKRAVIRLAKKFKANTILVEKAATGTPLIDDLRDEGGAYIPSPIGITPKGSKEQRAALVSPRIEAGDIFLPTQAVWRDAFVHEVIAFPAGTHDDQVDALVQLLSWKEPYEDFICGPEEILFDQVEADDFSEEEFLRDEF
ncbi:MAG TPA: terminase [Henriciella marina]|nr:terminase [Henriciella marina]